MTKINYYKCEFCGKSINGSNFKKHLKVKHKKTLKDNTLLRLNLKEEDLPKCKYCDNYVYVGLELSKICDSDSCKEKFKHENRSNAAKKSAEKMINSGTFNMLKSNRNPDLGTKISNSLKENKSSHFLKINKDLLRRQLEYGTHPWLSKNRKRVSEVIRIENRDEINSYEKLTDKDFLLENFSDSNYFYIKSMMEYFNISRTTANKYKKHLKIYLPNKTEKHKTQNDIYKYIKRVLMQNGKVPNVLQDQKNVIKGKELDIYLPDYNLAFEYDGLYYHSNIESNYHVNKTNLCEEKFIHLFHIFENEWKSSTKREIWKSMIKNSLSLNTVIYARNCTVKILHKGTKEFLTSNHMQGFTPAKWSYGLYYEDNLVSLMTFSPSRYDKNYDYELIRFCNLKGFRVVGGASKLLKHFRLDHKGSIVSYANRRWSQGKLYEALGFKKVKVLKPEYYHFKDGTGLLSRTSTQKWKLKDLLDNYKPELTELQNLKFNNYRIIYDCGNIKYIIK